MIGKENDNSVESRMMVRVSNNLVLARSQVGEELLLRLSASSVVLKGTVLLSVERTFKSVSSVAS